MDPNISVIIANYNRFDLLKRVVESMLAQTHPVSEIIIIDDGSIDNTPEALPRYIAERPTWRERVRYFYQENQGQAAAFNNGIARAKGEWFAFNSNDDPWLPQKLEWQFRALDQFKDQCEACFTDAWFMNDTYMKMTAFQFARKQHNESIGMITNPVEYVLNSEHDLPTVWVQTVVVRADLVRHVGGFDVNLRYGEDDDFVFRLACETNFCFVSMPMVLIDRTPAPQRYIGAGKNWLREDFLLQMHQYRFEKQLRMSERLSPEIQRSVRRKLSAVHSGWANLHLHNQQYEKAREAVSKAVKYYLTPNIAIKWILTQIVPKVARKVMLLRN